MVGLKIEYDVAVPMRDGVVLRADIYRPEGEVRGPSSFPGRRTARPTTMSCRPEPTLSSRGMTCPTWLIPTPWRQPTSPHIREASRCPASTSLGGTTFTDWLVLVYLAIPIAAGGLFSQTWAQARLSPTRSALILTSEPVFAAGFAIGLGGEELTLRLVIGGTVVFCAILLTELGRIVGSRREPSCRSARFGP